MLDEALNTRGSNYVTAFPCNETNYWDDVVRAVRTEYLSDSQDYPWIIGFSGGKDSTVVAQAVFEALLQVPPSQRRRHVHFVSNDTLVESPMVMAHLAKVQSAIASYSCYYPARSR